MQPTHVKTCSDCQAWIFDLTVEYCPFCIEDDEEEEYKLEMEAAIADYEDVYITEFIEEPVIKPKKPCRFGDACRNIANCKFSHEKPDVLCKFGKSCSRPTTCRYKH